MGLQSPKQRAALARAIAEDLRHCQPRVVIEDRSRHPTKECKRRQMVIAESLRALGWIGLHEDRIAVRQRYHQEVDFSPGAADHCPSLAKVGFRVTRRVRQEHERLSHRQPARMDVISHRRIAAIEPTLLAQPIVNPLDRMTLLLRRIQSIRQDLIDKTNMRRQLQAMPLFPPAITRRHRVP